MTSLPITVIITAHNHGRFVEQAIDSVLSQDSRLGKVQIIVVDDGSTDDTAERVKKYRPRIEYCYKPNGGQAAALNFGLARATGEIIALLDADDYFLPGKLKRIVDAFGANPALVLVYHQLREWHERTGEERIWPFTSISGDFSRPGCEFWEYVAQPTSAIALRRASLAPLMPIPEKIAMLADCYLTSLIPFLGPILAVPEPLAVYRIHGANNFTAAEQDRPEAKKKKREMWATVITAMRQWLSDEGYDASSPAVRFTLGRWELFEASEDFGLQAPDRLRFFKHLLLYDRCYGPYIPRRIRLINYLNAAGALFTGYKHFPLFHGSRRQSRQSEGLAE